MSAKYFLWYRNYPCTRNIVEKHKYLETKSFVKVMIDVGQRDAKNFQNN